jgi:hypothetical protein
MIFMEEMKIGDSSPCKPETGEMRMKRQSAGIDMTPMADPGAPLICFLALSTQPGEPLVIKLYTSS